MNSCVAEFLLIPVECFSIPTLRHYVFAQTRFFFVCIADCIESRNGGSIETKGRAESQGIISQDIPRKYAGGDGEEEEGAINDQGGKKECPL